MSRRPMCELCHYDYAEPGCCGVCIACFLAFSEPDSPEPTSGDPVDAGDVCNCEIANTGHAPWCPMFVDELPPDVNQPPPCPGDPSGGAA